MSDQPIIVVKKVKKGHGGHHGGAWKVAYADFVTAMMALFIVLWILGQDSETKQMVAAYFQDPKAFDQAVAAGLYSQDSTSEDHYNTPEPFLIPTAEPEVHNNGGHGDGSGEAEKKKIQEMAEKLMVKINSVPEFEKIKDKINIEIKDNSAVIELVEPEGDYFFDISDANMKPKAKKLLGLIAKELNKLPNQIVIAGHTDSRPFKSKHYTNWELSADRANSARRVMIEYGFDPDKILEVKGCADRFLKCPEDPEDPMNRRITIVVIFEDTQVDGGGYYPSNDTHKEESHTVNNKEDNHTGDSSEDSHTDSHSDNNSTGSHSEGNSLEYKIYSDEPESHSEGNDSHH